MTVAAKPVVVPSPAALGPRGAASRDEAAIVLTWLVRLRWIAALGQLVAVLASAGLLGLGYRAAPLAGVIGVTLATNAVLALGVGRGLGFGLDSRSLAAGIVVLDILLLTALLYLTGGGDNPFALLYVLHVALAASVLGTRWTWTVVGVVALCYAIISFAHEPLAPGRAEISPNVLSVGRAAALLLVVGLIAYFVSRVVAALGSREAELAGAREQAQVSERLAALTTLAAGAAHELGTPLATIAVVSKEMERSARHAAQLDLADDAVLVRRQVDRCRDILERLRGDVAGRTTDEPGTCDPIEVADDVCRELRPDRCDRLDVRLAGDLPPAVAAASRAVRQALGLLVNNAFDAAEEAGLDGERGRVSLDVRRAEGNRVRFAVADRGPGMDDESLRRAVEPFYTTKDPGRGMGLGLFLVRLVAERNGGAFELSSEPGRGTTARLDLPASSA